MLSTSLNTNNEIVKRLWHEAQTAAINIDPVYVTKAPHFKQTNERERKLIFMLCHASKIEEAADTFIASFDLPEPVTFESAVRFLSGSGRKSGTNSVDYIHVGPVDHAEVYLCKFTDPAYLRRFPELEPKMRAAASHFLKRIQKRNQGAPM
jgi:hypothetical protein